MKILGIDYGRRRIGVAITDETASVVRGCNTIDQKTCSDPIRVLADLIAKESPGAIVFGVPLGPRSEETVMSQEVRSFAGRMRRELHLDLPLHFVDESFSSVESQRQLLIRKKKQRRDKALINKIAACNILETFLKEQQCGQCM